MKLDCLPIGLYEENSYVLHQDQHVLLIDPGRYAEKIAAKVLPAETVDAILLTHGHEDHTGAVDDLADRYGCPVYLNPADDPLVLPAEKGQHGFDAPIYHVILPLCAGSCQIGTFKVTVYATPGHTAGSVLIRVRNLLFTGDTLFAGDVGRTDLFSGSEADLIKSMALIRTLPSDLIVYPGHGPSSTLGVEKQSNPYLIGF